MKKTEHYWNASINPQEHGYNGNVWIQTITSTDRYYPLFPYELQAWAELNVTDTPSLDANTGHPNGVGELNENRHDGRRQLSCSVYSQAGITLMTNTLVEKILLQNTTTHGPTTAIGIQLANGTQIHAHKEMIVSTGGIRTPQLLMLSGIGPVDELTALNIPVHVPSPDVGKNLADHTIFYYTWKSATLPLAGSPDLVIRCSTNPNIALVFPTISSSPPPRPPRKRALSLPLRQTRASRLAQTTSSCGTLPTAPFLNMPCTLGRLPRMAQQL